MVDMSIVCVLLLVLCSCCYEFVMVELLFVFCIVLNVRFV